MPRYVFEFTDGCPGDPIQLDCASPEEARRIVVRTLPELARDKLHAGEKNRKFGLVVRDESGEPVYSATLALDEAWLKKNSARD